MANLTNQPAEPEPEDLEALARRMSALADELHAEELRLLARDFKAARAAAGKTYLEVARLTGLSPATVFRLERGDQCDLRTYLAARNWLDNEALSSAVKG